jgi:hypothetical protein
MNAVPNPMSARLTNPTKSQNPSMKTHIRIVFAMLLLGAVSASSTAQAQSGRQANAIWIRDSAKVGNLTYHTSGVSASASTARQNIVDTAKCLRAQTSWYGDAGTSYVWLHSTMLSTIHTLASTYGYSMLVTEYAGGDHSSGSYHYRGTAFDVATINGRGVSSSNPYWRSFNQRCRDRGAVECLGPGFPGHDTHVHNAWPSGTSASAAGGCITEVSAPSSLNATVVDSDSIKVTWRDNSSIESSFTLQKSGTSSTGPWSTAATLGANVESKTVSGLGSGKRYWFRVRAQNSQDTSPWSNVDNATTKDTKAAAPTALTATAVSQDQINLAWTDNSNNEDGFKIYRSTDGTNYAAIKTVGINVRTYSNTGLTGNRKYYYKVYAYNTIGNSSASNVASDTTAPQAPTTLTVSAVAGTTNWNRLNLSWVDNANAEVGFKVERGTAAAGPFSQIATTAASVTTYQDSGLAATTTYYYRVRSYNANGNSDYSNIASRATGNSPPVLTAIGNKTVNAGANLAFTVTASDPNAPATSTAWIGTWDGSADGTDEVVFRNPINSATTSGYINTSSTNYTTVKSGAPSGVGGSQALKAGWSFKTGTTNYWVRFNTFNAPSLPNLTIGLDQTVRFRLWSTKALKVGMIVRETGTTAAYAANGGTTGTLEYVGVTNIIGSSPIPNRTVNPSNWTTLTFNIPFESQMAFTGDGKVDQSGAKGVLDAIVLYGAGGTGSYVTWLDDLHILINNYKTYSLDAGAPAGATIGRRNGKFSWTPTTAQAGAYNITVRVTDNLGAQDFETIRVTVVGTGNAAPVLAAIGNKTVNEGSTLSFTATATDANAGQALTFSLIGAPAGASISTAGAFSWTPTEAQGAGSYPFTVRVTDNGSPVSNDSETITVTVNEVNTPPVMTAIADQTANETQAFSFTPSSTDADAPAQTLTYSLVSGPETMTINPSNGQLSWTPSEADGPDTNQVTIRVRDSGTPSLIAERTFNVIVNEVNLPPALTVGSSIVAGIPITDFETFADGTYNGTVFFRQPSFSSTTTNYLDPAPVWSSVTDTFPEGVAGSRVLNTYFSFKTGTVNPWVRLTTFNTTAGYAVPNPTIDFSRKLRFRMYSDRSVGVALGLRETSSTAAIGLDGGISGTLEWIGASATGSSPVPTRTIEATNWTTIEFDPSGELVTAFPGSGNGVLSSTTGKGVFEHLAITPAAGNGLYNLYFDNFEVLSSSSNFVIETGKTITFTNTATDPDDPKQQLTFSLEPNAPSNAIIDSKTGIFEWTPLPEQGGGAFVFGIRITDDGVPALSDVKNVTIQVTKVNTAPRLTPLLAPFYVNPGETVEWEAEAVDADLPGDTLTWSFVGAAPAGATLVATNGHFTWTPTSANGSNEVVIRVTDSGVPALYDELTLVVVVSPVNNAPTLAATSARVTEKVVTFETFAAGTANEAVMFKKPANSTTTSSYIDTNATNYTTVTSSFPSGNANAGARALRATWSFKTGITNYWVRLVTFNTTSLANPTINASARLKFDIRSDKALKVGLGIRETTNTVENGANGGSLGPIEYVGCTSKVGTTPIPTRSVAANTWTTLEFDLPAEPCQTLTGNSILAAGQQVLEHLILKGEGGTGAYNVYLDNFEVVSVTPLASGASTDVTMKSSSTLTFNLQGSDVDAHPLTYGLELGAPAEATLAANVVTWTPPTTYNGTTNEITGYVEDYPPGGYQAKRAYVTANVVVIADGLNPQSAPDGTSVGTGETATVEWNAIPGHTYQVQVKDADADAWTNVGEPIVATKTDESVTLQNGGSTRLYRILEVGGASAE